MIELVASTGPQSGRSIVGDLKALRAAVASGRCRVGAQGSDSLPCLLGLIMEMVPYSEHRDRLIDAIALHMPGNEMLRSQMRMMRYCRNARTTRRSVLKVLDESLIRCEAGIRALGPRLAMKRLLRFAA